MEGPHYPQFEAANLGNKEVQEAKEQAMRQSSATSNPLPIKDTDASTAVSRTTGTLEESKIDNPKKETEVVITVRKKEAADPLGDINTSNDTGRYDSIQRVMTGEFPDKKTKVLDNLKIFGPILGNQAIIGKFIEGVRNPYASAEGPIKHQLGSFGRSALMSLPVLPSVVALERHLANKRKAETGAYAGSPLAATLRGAGVAGGVGAGMGATVNLLAALINKKRGIGANIPQSVITGLLQGGLYNSVLGGVLGYGGNNALQLKDFDDKEKVRAGVKQAEEVQEPKRNKSLGAMALGGLGVGALGVGGGGLGWHLGRVSARRDVDDYLRKVVRPATFDYPSRFAKEDYWRRAQYDLKNAIDRKTSWGRTIGGLGGIALGSLGFHLADRYGLFDKKSKQEVTKMGSLGSGLVGHIAENGVGPEVEAYGRGLSSAFSPDEKGERYIQRNNKSPAALALGGLGAYDLVTRGSNLGDRIAGNIGNARHSAWEKAMLRSSADITDEAYDAAERRILSAAKKLRTRGALLGAAGGAALGGLGLYGANRLGFFDKKAEEDSQHWAAGVEDAIFLLSR